MPGIKAKNYQQTTGAWAGDFSDRKSHIPGGITLDAAAFPVGTFPDGIVPSGTLVGRTAAERDADTPFGPFAAGDAEVYLTFDVAVLADDPAVAAYRPGCIVYPMHLPATSKVAAAAAEIERLYIVNKGRE